MTTPTLYQWVGGEAVLAPVLTAFYDQARKDPLLAELFAGFDDVHAQRVTEFILEVLGGPKTYSERHGGHPAMIRRHLGKHMSEAQRRRWVALLLDAYEAGPGPKDPEFASALVAYLEWGSRIAVVTSQAETSTETAAPMPAWGWGVPGGPWQGGKG